MVLTTFRAMSYKSFSANEREIGSKALSFPLAYEDMIKVLNYSNG